MSDASPQLENGYTRLANELLDAFISAGLTARQWSVVMAIIRKTYGFNKTSDEIGLSQLSAMTGLDKSNLSRTVRELESAKVIHRGNGTHGHTLGINKKHKQWELSNKQPQLSKQQPLSEQQPGVVETTTVRVVDLTIQELSERQPQYTSLKTTGKTTPKDTLSRSLRERFEILWEVYPKKKSKDKAEKAFAKRKPNEQLFAEMMNGLARATTSVEWLKDDGEFIPYAATWLNAGGWKDEYKAAAYSPEELDVLGTYNASMSADWPQAVADPFSASRAASIREFLEFQPGKRDMPKRYFEHCNANLAVDERCGFDWLIRRETYLRVREGAVKHKDAA